MLVINNKFPNYSFKINTLIIPSTIGVIEPTKINLIATLSSSKVSLLTVSLLSIFAF